MQLFAVKSKYGTPREFKEFVKQCHLRQIAVIVDQIASAAQKSSAVCRAQLGAVPPARAAAPRVLRSHLAGMDAFRSGSGVRGVRRALPRDQVAHAQGPGKDRERGVYEECTAAGRCVCV